jgi:PAS domain S-box-containing protein
MFQTEPVRDGGIWHNLPLRAKAAVCLLLPVPVLALTVVVLGVLGIHEFRFLVVPGAALELFAFLWVIQAAHRQICELQGATEQICEGESVPEMPRYSWELNVIRRNLESVAATLQQQEKEIADSREQAARMFEDTPAAYLEADAQGAVTRANRGACQLLGRTAEEICGMHIREVFGDAEGPPSENPLPGNPDRREATEAFEKEYVRPDGTQFTIGVQESLLRDLTGTFTGSLYS